MSKFFSFRLMEENELIIEIVVNAIDKYELSQDLIRRLLMTLNHTDSLNLSLSLADWGLPIPFWAIREDGYGDVVNRLWRNSGS